MTCKVSNQDAEKEGVDKSESGGLALGATIANLGVLCGLIGEGFGNIYSGRWFSFGFTERSLLMACTHWLCGNGLIALRLCGIHCSKSVSVPGSVLCEEDRGYYRK